MPEVATTTCNQCMFGCIADSTKHDDKVPAMKPTRFMSNSPIMLEQLTRKCDRQHAHKPLHGKDCEMAAYYPLPLIRDILKGIRLQHAEDKIRRDHFRENRRIAQLAVYAARPAQVEIPVVKVLGNTR